MKLLKLVFALFLFASSCAYSMQYTKKFLSSAAAKYIKFTKPSVSPFARQIGRAETLFYKPNGEPITEKEHDILYDIKLRKQFPMSIEHGDGNVPDDEIVAMQEELDEKLPGVKVAFIPTTLYELLSIQSIQNERIDLEGAPFSYGDPGESYDSGYKESKKFQKMRQLHHMINTSMSKFLIDKKIDLQKADCASYEGILKKYLGFGGDDYRKALMRIIEIECAAQKNNQFLLYRGTTQLENTPQGNQSLSLGNSLFAGSLYDSPACAHEHYFEPQYQRYGYVVPIDKKRYIQGDLKNMFYIPPLSSIEGLVGKDEFFHARTKIMSDAPVDATYADGLSGALKYPVYKTYVNRHITISAQSPEESVRIHNDIFNYIATHRRVIVSPQTSSRKWAYGTVGAVAVVGALFVAQQIAHNR